MAGPVRYRDLQLHRFIPVARHANSSQKYSELNCSLFPAGLAASWPGAGTVTGCSHQRNLCRSAQTAWCLTQAGLHNVLKMLPIVAASSAGKLCMTAGLDVNSSPCTIGPEYWCDNVDARGVQCGFSPNMEVRGCCLSFLCSQGLVQHIGIMLWWLCRSTHAQARRSAAMSP